MIIGAKFFLPHYKILPRSGIERDTLVSVLGFVPGFMYGLCMNDCDQGLMGYVMCLSDSRFHGMGNLIV